jgi:hypothetical protein
MIKITKSRKHDKVKFNDLIYVDYPHINSRAGYILLRHYFFFQGPHFDEMNKWLNFRHIYLSKVLKKEGDLVCHYCGETHLVIGHRDVHLMAKNTRNKKLATIDHINPLGGGGNKYDESNFVVSCKKCNNKKADKPYDEYMASIKKTK